MLYVYYMLWTWFKVFLYLVHSFCGFGPVISLFNCLHIWFSTVYKVRSIVSEGTKWRFWKQKKRVKEFSDKHMSFWPWKSNFRLMWSLMRIKWQWVSPHLTTKQFDFCISISAVYLSVAAIISTFGQARIHIITCSTVVGLHPWPGQTQSKDF